MLLTKYYAFLNGDTHGRILSHYHVLRCYRYDMLAVLCGLNLVNSIHLPSHSVPNRLPPCQWRLCATNLAKSRGQLVITTELEDPWYKALKIVAKHEVALASCNDRDTACYQPDHDKRRSLCIRMVQEGVSGRYNVSNCSP